MASILKVDELQGITAAGDITVTSEGGAATQSLQQGLAKAWVNFNGTGTIATRDSLNVSGLVDNGTGDYTVNFSSSFDNANYTYAFSSNGGSSSFIREAQQGTVATASFSYLAKYWSAITTANADDATYQNIVIHGDLA